MAPPRSALPRKSVDEGPRLDGRTATRFFEYEWVRLTPFWTLHALALVGLVQGATKQVWVWCGILYVVRIWGMTAGYHRYFAHRSFKTSRAGQFLLAVLAQLTFQRGALWWAFVHRHHHRSSDEPRDVHSPRQHGFWHSHFLWIYDDNRHTDYSKIPDLARYRELVVLNELWFVPPLILAAIVTATMGFSGLCVAFCLSTVLGYHSTFAVNSVAHVVGSRRFETSDDSRNNWLLALLTLGEGWHNNHHRFPSRCRMTVAWWELDPTYWGLRILAVFGLVWDLRDGRSERDRAQERASAIVPVRPQPRVDKDIDCVPGVQPLPAQAG